MELDEQIEEVEVFTGLLHERLIHKNWKARKQAYEELRDVFSNTTPVEDYSTLFKDMVLDPNIIAQESAIEVFLVYFDRFPDSKLVAQQIATPLIEKCLCSQKTSMQQKAQNLLQLFIEIEVPDIVCLLVQGFKQRNTKGRLACVQSTVEALKNFGWNISVKEILKTGGLPALFSDQDGKVRKEAQTLTVEIYKYMKDPLKDLPFFVALRDTQKNELEKLFEVVKDQTPKPAKALRNGRSKNNKLTNINEPAPSEVIDVADMIEAVSVLNKLSNKFFEIVGGSDKWTVRKTELEFLEKLTSAPKLINDDYLEVIKLLKKLLDDSQIPLVILSIKIIGQLANGLGCHFSCYIRFVFAALLNKFKEKKITILEPLNYTLKTIHKQHNNVLCDNVEDIINAISNKIPQVRQYTLEWINNCLMNTEKQIVSKTWKAISLSVVKGCEDSCGPVRDAALRIFARVQVLLGEQSVTQFKAKMDKKQLEKLCIFGKQDEETFKSSHTPREHIQPQANLRVGAKRDHASPTSSEEPPPVKRSSAAVNKNVIRKKITSTGKSKEEDLGEEIECVPQGEFEQHITKLIPDLESVQKKLNSKSFNERFEAIERVQEFVGKLSDDVVNTNCEALVWFLKNNPGWKESNFQILNKMFQMVNSIVIRSQSFSKRCTFHVIDGLIDKIADGKQKQICKDCLLSICEAVGTRLVFTQIMKFVAECKSPKHISECLDFMAIVINSFGTQQLDIKGVVTFVKSNFDKNNPEIKKSGIKLLVALRITKGAYIRDLLNDIKPQLLTIIEAEFSRIPKQSFQPKRFIRGAAVPLVPLVESYGDRMEDLSTQITSTLISRLSDNNWQVRQNALNKVESIIQNVRPASLSTNVGQLMVALKARLSDANKNIMIQALNILQKLIVCMGPAFKVHLKVCAPAIFQLFSDNKAQIRSFAVSTLQIIENEIGFEHMVCYMTRELTTDSPMARIDLSQWIATTLSTKKSIVNPLLLAPLVKPLIALVQDRNPEIRSNAATALIYVQFITNLDLISKETRDMKPAIAKAIHATIDSQRTAMQKSLYSDKENSSPLDEYVRNAENVHSQEMNLDQPFPVIEGIRMPLAPHNFQTEQSNNKNGESFNESLNVSKARTDLKLEEELNPIYKTSNIKRVNDFCVVRPPPPTEHKPMDYLSRTGHCTGHGNPIDSIPVLLEHILSGNDLECINSLCIIKEAYLNNEDYDVTDSVNTILETIMKRVQIIVETTIPYRVTKLLLDTLAIIFSREKLAQQVAYDLKYHTIFVLLNCLSLETVQKVPEKKLLVRNLNDVVQNILINANRATTFQCLIERFGEYVDTPDEDCPKIVGILVRCTLKLTQYEYPKISDNSLRFWFQVIHDFLAKYPQLAFNGNEQIFRCIKTVLRTFVRAKHDNIKDIVQLPADSGIWGMINICLDSLQVENASKDTNMFNMITASMPPPPNLGQSKSKTQITIESRLDVIFKLARNASTTHIGIKDLNDFMKEHPEFDLKPWLCQCSAEFQSYIQRQLKQLNDHVPVFEGSSSTPSHIHGMAPPRPIVRINASQMNPPVISAEPNHNIQSTVSTTNNTLPTYPPNSIEYVRQLIALKRPDLMNVPRMTSSFTEQNIKDLQERIRRSPAVSRSNSLQNVSDI